MLELCRCPNIYGPDCITHQQTACLLGDTPQQHKAITVQEHEVRKAAGPDRTPGKVLNPIRPEIFHNHPHTKEISHGSPHRRTSRSAGATPPEDLPPPPPWTHISLPTELTDRLRMQ